MSSSPFQRIGYDAGVLSDRRVVRLESMTADGASRLGPACAAIDPWHRYGIPAERLTAAFATHSDGAFRYQVRVGDDVAGVMIIAHPWLLGPYLQFIAVLPAWQGLGVGRELLSWFEGQARSSGQRNIWLCVTGFNERARAVYRAHGFDEAATLSDLVQTGVPEVLMRKRLF
jgi:ribosomal protein S18 acetylase RimI-like enzyme